MKADSSKSDEKTHVIRDARRGTKRRELQLVVALEGELRAYAVPARGVIRIGRSPQADVSIEDTSVSRQHAILHTAESGYTIEDQGSSNGTWIRNSRLAPKEQHPIALGERARLGAVPVWVEETLEDRDNPTDPLGTKRPDTTPFVIEAEVMVDLYQLVDKVSRGTIDVLLIGETGVGKEVIAHEIHRRSTRASKPFLALNCAAFAETLFESQLFGHEKGAFTGATSAKAGLLENAGGGTVFLDEVGEMPLSCQAKLLRAIAQRRVLRLGSFKPRPIDVRFIAATNRNLEEEVATGRFRKDLYFRLNGVTLSVPPLRDRREEIEPLARQYLAHFTARLGRANPPGLAPGVLELIVDYSWPGNIRELRNVIERAVLLCGDAEINEEHLLIGKSDPGGMLAETQAMPKPRPLTTKPPQDMGQRARSTESYTLASLQEELEKVERDKILSALEACGGNQSRTAKLLGMSRNTLIRKLDRYGVPRPRKRGSSDGTG